MAAVVIAGGFFAFSAVSAAVAEDQPQGLAGERQSREASLFIGDEPVFYTPQEGIEKFARIVNADSALQGLDISIAMDGAPAMFPNADKDGYPIKYESGYIESVAATASRCIQISAWISDPAISSDEVRKLSDQQFQEYASVPAVAELSNANEEMSGTLTSARAAGEDPVVFEAKETCGVFGLNGGAP
ncbi:hypothetical protein [Leucobacter sp. wl10]|uniref:hypothetical protein n=1 Tax=Leucobacter sp. wl10 TaxID=2304677 RepID=UPI000E84ED06|nr:hypothetical protein [Leucobacter sp. wl10]RGE19646.1 hypothetical protein D1J51_11370 [Leucobacter sp. wl10]